MTDLNEELWKLGILAKTEHNEVCPRTARTCPDFFPSPPSQPTTNQLTMEMMKKIAQRHGLVCLLHEKPFAGVKRLRQAQQLVDVNQHRLQSA